MITSEVRVLGRQVAALRERANAANPLFMKTRRGRTLARQVLEQVIDRARKEGVAEFLGDRKGLRASFLFFRDSESSMGVPVNFVMIDYAAGDSGAFRWLKRRLEANAHRFDEKTLIFLPKAYTRLLPFCQQQGFHLDSLVLMGQPGKALARLRNKHAPATDLRAHGLEIVELQTPAQLHQVMAIFKREFLRNPRYGWFCSDRRYLKIMRGRLLESLNSAEKTHFVIQSGSRVFGYFGFDISRYNPFWRSLAGLEVTLDRSIQGKGFAKVAYHYMLERMIRLRVRVFRGGTSQPAVLALSRDMGRFVDFYVLKFGPSPFQPGHFQYKANK